MADIPSNRLAPAEPPAEQPTPAAPEKQAKAALGGAEYNFVDTQPHVVLNSGHTMPMVGLGTWKSPKGEIKMAVEAAIRAGYRHIDCAYVYENEHEIGEALTTILNEGVVKRSDLHITSKLWNTFHDEASVEPACRRTLKDLGLDYLDLYLIHWPVTGNKGPTLQPPYASTWAAMERLVSAGLVRSIGVSNLSVAKLEKLIGEGCKIVPAVNQVECHPYFRNERLIEYCTSKGIHVTAYSPLGSPDSASVVKRKHSLSLMKDPLVLELANKYGRDLGQVLVKWAVQRGTSVLPKSVKPERIRSNFDHVVQWQLSEEDFKRLSNLEIQIRMVDGSMWLNPEGPYKTLSELWDDPEEDEREARMEKLIAARGQM